MPRFSWASFGLATTTLSVLLTPVVARAEPSPTSVHVVQPGDTLLQIALDAGTDTEAVLALNDLSDSNVLAVGQTLKLPAKSLSAAPISTPAASNAAPGTYTIASGDNLWDIAQRFGTTTDAIVQTNHLDDPDHLSLGTVLTLPAGAKARSAPTTTPAPASSPSSASKRSVVVSYTVQPGETLSQIAKQFSVQAGAIVQASILDDANKLAVGTVLKVPVAAKEHVVTSGETLRDIAANEKVDLGSLVDLNQIDAPELIRVGQVLLLPVAGVQGPASGAAAATPMASPQTTGARAQATPTPAAASAQGQVAAAAPAPPQNTSAASASTSATLIAAAVAPSTTAAAMPAPRPSPVPSPAAAATPKPPAAPAPAPAAGSPPGAPSDALASTALKLVGSPYVWGGSTPSGFDCSGLVWYVARQLNKQVGRGMLGQYNSGSHPSRDDLKPGDLVFFQNTWAPGLSHNGVYIGNRKFVNAADETSGVTISSLDSAYWTSHWFGATRVP